MKNMKFNIPGANCIDEISDSGTLKGAPSSAEYIAAINSSTAVKFESKTL
jgi:hypothetical protein